MVTIDIKTKKKRSGFEEVLTQCPFLIGSDVLVGTDFCCKCKFHVNHKNKNVWCIGDEHPYKGTL